MSALPQPGIVHRAVLVSLSLALLAGCSGGDPEVIDQADPTACTDDALHDYTLYLHNDRLVPIAQTPAKTPANGFTEGFANNDLREFLSDPQVQGIQIEGNVTFELWVEYNGSPAPVAIGGDPGEGYHFFNLVR